MKRFLAVWKQGSGCDYTIGCGIQTQEFAAIDLDAARETVIKDVVDQDSENEIVQVEIYELAGPNCKLVDTHWKDQIEANRLAKEQAKQDQRDRTEFERLSAKFGKR